MVLICKNVEAVAERNKKYTGCSSVTTMKVQTQVLATKFLTVSSIMEQIEHSDMVDIIVFTSTLMLSIIFMKHL